MEFVQELVCAGIHRTRTETPLLPGANFIGQVVPIETHADDGARSRSAGIEETYVLAASEVCTEMYYCNFSRFSSQRRAR